MGFLNVKHCIGQEEAYNNAAIKAYQYKPYKPLTVQDTLSGIGQDLLAAMNSQFETMNQRLEESQENYHLSLITTIQAQIHKDVEDETEAMKRRISNYMGSEIAAFKTETNTQIEKLHTKLREKVISTSEVKKELGEYRAFIDLFEAKYEEHKKWKEGQDKTEKDKDKAFNQLSEKVKELEKMITATNQQTDKVEVELNARDRTWRGYNIRASMLHSEGKQEDGRLTFAKFVQKHNLLPKFNNLHDILREIEFGFRVGPKKQGMPKQMLVRFHNTRIRNEVMQNSKESKY